MPDATFTFDELNPSVLAWHPAGFIWSPGPGCSQPVYRWPIESDASGELIGPDLTDPNVNVVRANEFPWAGWRHLADCTCEECTPCLCPTCAELMYAVDVEAHPLGYSPDHRPNLLWREQGLCCEYEHCIETMPLHDGPTEGDCSIFGHECPGGADIASICGGEVSDLHCSGREVSGGWSPSTSDMRDESGVARTRALEQHVGPMRDDGRDTLIGPPTVTSLRVQSGGVQ